MDKKHDVLSELKRLASEMGKVPTRDEFRDNAKVTEHDMRSAFGGYSQLLMAAGFKGRDLAKEHKAKKFKFSKSQIESFNLVEFDLEQLFEKCGNPESIKIIAQPDTHVKYRDQKAVDVFLKFLSWFKPHGHIIMGDFIDAEGISHWPNDSLEPRRFIPEIKEGRELLEKILNATPHAQFRAYLGGNHEDWINQAMSSKLPELFNGLEELGLMPDLEALLDLKKYGYELIQMNHILKLGKAHFTHGLYTGGNHPKKHLDAIKGNIYYGHLHDVKSTHEPTITGMIEAASLGCLCRLDAKFLKGKPSNWVHGFGIFEFLRDGSYSFYQVKIFNGRFSYAGKVFAV